MAERGSRRRRGEGARTHTDRHTHIRPHAVTGVNFEGGLCTCVCGGLRLARAFGAQQRVSSSLQAVIIIQGGNTHITHIHSLTHSQTHTHT